MEDHYWYIDTKSSEVTDGNTLVKEPEMLYTHNETNTKALYNVPNQQPYVKDGIDSYVVRGDKEAVNPKKEGKLKRFFYKPFSKHVKKSLILFVVCMLFVVCLFVFCL